MCIYSCGVIDDDKIVKKEKKTLTGYLPRQAAKFAVVFCPRVNQARFPGWKD